MHCSDEREKAFNILSFAFKMVYKVLETISKSLYICAFDSSRLSTAFIIAALVSIVMHLLLIVFVDKVVMVIEN